MPFRPTIAVDDFIRSADPGVEKMILGASDMPNSIANPVLIQPGTCESFFLRQIIRIVTDDTIQIGELLFEIGSHVHYFLPYL